MAVTDGELDAHMAEVPQEECPFLRHGIMAGATDCKSCTGKSKDECKGDPWQSDDVCMSNVTTIVYAEQDLCIAQG